MMNIGVEQRLGGASWLRQQLEGRLGDCDCKRKRGGQANGKRGFAWGVSVGMAEGPGVPTRKAGQAGRQEMVQTATLSCHSMSSSMSSSRSVPTRRWSQEVQRSGR